MINIKSYGKSKQAASVSTSSGYAGVGGTGVSAQWVDDNFVSKSFFSSLFAAHPQNDNTTEIAPNNTTTQVGSIESKYGLWTKQFMSALGINSSGGGSGGGGGASSLNELSDVQITNPTNGQALLYDSSTLLWKNGTVSGGGGGTGSVTSVGMTMPTGLQVSGSPITSSGTFAVTYASGYSIPTTTKQNSWDGAVTGVQTLNGYFTNGVANSASTATTASKLSTTSKTAWGQQYWTSGGIPTNISGDMTSVGNVTTGSSGGTLSGFNNLELNTNGNETGNGGYIDFHYNGSSSDYTSRIIEDKSGRVYVVANEGLRIGNGVIKWDSTNNALEFVKSDGTAINVYSTGGISALGLNAGTSVGDMTFDNVTINDRLYISNYGSITSSGGGMKLSSPQSIKINSDDVYVDPAGGVHAKKFYLSGTTYLHVDNGVLKFYDGTTDKTVNLT